MSGSGAAQRFELGRDPVEVGRARRLVADACQGCPSVDLQVAQLLASELVTNAIQHGRGRITLAIQQRAEDLRVEVADEADETVPAPAAGDPLQTSGRGLAMVAALSQGWGVERNAAARQKVVWFHLAADDGRT